MLNITELVSIDGYWRRQCAERFPDDCRNNEAAELLDRLEPEIAALNGSFLHRHLVRLCSSPRHLEDLDRNGDRVAARLRRVGFNYFPVSGDALLRDIIRDVEYGMKEVAGFGT